MFKDDLATHPRGELKFDDWFEFIYLGIQSHKAMLIVFAKVLIDSELIQIKMPTLFLTRENEIIYSVQKTLKRLRTVALNIELQVIENVGHHLPLAQPKQVNQAILDFLNSKHSII